MLKQQVKMYSLFIIGLLSIILSIIIFSYGFKIVRLLTYLVAIVLFLSSLSKTFLTIIKKNKEKIFPNLIKIVINTIFALVIILFNNYVLASITLVFVLYLWLISTINFIGYLIYKRNNVNGRINILINSIISLIFALIVVSDPYMHLKYFLLYLATYLLLYGLENMFNYVLMALPIKIKKQIRIPLPTIMSLILPKALIFEINELLKVDKIEEFNSSNNLNPDIYVIIHLANSGSSAYGHMEIAYKDTIYSYGNYNMHARKLFESIGDGIILIADKEKYINYCIHNKKRYLIEFGISLTTEQKKEVEDRISDLINNNTIEFYPDSALYERGLIEQKEFKDMSSDLYTLTNAHFKKIISGKNKTFFALRNNCAAFANQILDNNKILNINGILSPGAYYDYLNDAYKLKNSNVVTRRIYMEDMYAGITRSRNSKRNLKKNSFRERNKRSKSTL